MLQWPKPAGVTQLVECQPSKLMRLYVSDYQFVSYGPPLVADSNSAAADDLQSLIDAWPELPSAVRVGIVAMVNAGKR